MALCRGSKSRDFLTADSELKVMAGCTILCRIKPAKIENEMHVFANDR